MSELQNELCGRFQEYGFTEIYYAFKAGNRAFVRRPSDRMMFFVSPDGEVRHGRYFGQSVLLGTGSRIFEKFPLLARRR